MDSRQGFQPLSGTDGTKSVGGRKIGRTVGHNIFFDINIAWGYGSNKTLPPIKNGGQDMKKTHLSLVVAIVAIFTLAVPAFAAITIYDNEAEFLAQVSSGKYAENFSDYLWGDPYYGNVGSVTKEYTYNGGTLDEYSYSWTASAVGGLFSNGPLCIDDDCYSITKGLSTLYSSDPLIITFTGNPYPVTAVGGIFASSDYVFNDVLYDPNSLKISYGIITLTLNDGKSVTYSDSRFTGFTSSSPILSLTLNSNDYWPEFSHFYVGTAKPVPEPTTLLLLGLGLVGVAGIRRKLRN